MGYIMRHETQRHSGRVGSPSSVGGEASEGRQDAVGSRRAGGIIGLVGATVAGCVGSRWVGGPESQAASRTEAEIDRPRPAATVENPVPGSPRVGLSNRPD